VSDLDIRGTGFVHFGGWGFSEPHAPPNIVFDTYWGLFLPK